MKLNLRNKMNILELKMEKIDKVYKKNKTFKGIIL